MAYEQPSVAPFLFYAPGCACTSWIRHTGSLPTLFKFNLTHCLVHWLDILISRLLFPCSWQCHPTTKGATAVRTARTGELFQHFLAHHYPAKAIRVLRILQPTSLLPLMLFWRNQHRVRCWILVTPEPLLLVVFSSQITTKLHYESGHHPKVIWALYNTSEILLLPERRLSRFSTSIRWMGQLLPIRRNVSHIYEETMTYKVYENRKGGKKVWDDLSCIEPLSTCTCTYSDRQHYLFLLIL